MRNNEWRKRTGYRFPRDKSNAWAKADYAKRPEFYNNKNKDFHKKRPDIRKSLNRKYRARKLEAPGTHTQDDIINLFVTQKGLCAGPHCCKDISEKFQIDHKTPLTRGGSNGVENLQLLCFHCNNSKHTKTNEEWLELISNPRLTRWDGRAVKIAEGPNLESKMASKAKTESASVVDTEKFPYETTKIRGVDGKIRHSKNNGDAIAKAMLVLIASGGKLEKVIKDNGLAARMKGREAMNSGLRRMTVSVMLRKLVRDGTPVEIGDITVKKLDQVVKVPDEVAKPARAPRAKKVA